MKVYKIEFNDGWTTKTYIIAEHSSSIALAYAYKSECGYDLDGNMKKPLLTDFTCEVINGCFAKSEGIKSIIY